MGAIFVTVDTQLSLIPLDSPAMIALMTGQLVARIERLAPQMHPFQCNLTATQLAYVAICLDRIEVQLGLRWQPPVEKARRLGIV